MLGALPGRRPPCCTPQPGRVFLGDGDGRFSPAPANLFPVDTLLTVHPRKVLFADFNADGRADMFISSDGWDADPFPGEQNRLYLSRPEGGWRDATANLPQLSDFSHTSAAGDISGRGVLDIFVGNGYFANGRVDAVFPAEHRERAVHAHEDEYSRGQPAVAGPTRAQLCRRDARRSQRDGLAELIVTADIMPNGKRSHDHPLEPRRHLLEADTTLLPPPGIFAKTQYRSRCPAHRRQPGRPAGPGARRDAEGTSSMTGGSCRSSSTGATGSSWTKRPTACRLGRPRQAARAEDRGPWPVVVQRRSTSTRTGRPTFTVDIPGPRCGVPAGSAARLAQRWRRALLDPQGGRFRGGRQRELCVRRAAPSRGHSEWL